MKYVALLRGINVGGNNKIDMKQLVAAMQEGGFEDVSTYINSGNVFFTSADPEEHITKKLEELIEQGFNLNIKVLLRNKTNIDALAAAIPNDWVNNAEMKCDVMFLWEKYDNKSVLDSLNIKPGIDDVRYIHDALIWKVDAKHLTKSGKMKLPGSDLYKHMTIRNCNTVRKVQERMSQ